MEKEAPLPADDPTTAAVHYSRTGRISKSKHKSKVHRCECGRSYTRAEHLRQHKKNHEQDELRCDFPGCNMEFFRLDLLQRHQERHNEPGDDAPQPSPFEPLTFSTHAIPTPCLTQVSESSTYADNSEAAHFREQTGNIDAEIQPTICWDDPFSRISNDNGSRDSGYISDPLDVQGSSEHARLLPLTHDRSHRNRTFSITLFQPLSIGTSRSPSPNSTTACNSHWILPPIMAHMATSYPLESTPTSAEIDPMTGYGHFGPKLPDQGKATEHEGTGQSLRTTDSPHGGCPDPSATTEVNISESHSEVAVKCVASDEIERSTGTAIVSPHKPIRKSILEQLDQRQPEPHATWDVVKCGPDDSHVRGSILAGLGSPSWSVVANKAQYEESVLNLPQDFLQGFIAFFGDSLLEKAGARQWAACVLSTQSQEVTGRRFDLFLEAQETTERLLNDILNGYTIELTSKLPSSWPSQGSEEALLAPLSKQSHQVLAGAIELIRRYRTNIARYFCENAVAWTVNTVPLSARLQDLGQKLPLFKRCGILAKFGPDKLDPKDDKSSKFIVPLKTTNDESKAQTLKDLEILRYVLVSGDILNETALRIHQELFHDETPAMENMELIVKLRSYRSKWCFHMDWPLASHMRFQYGEQFPSIGEVIVITGSALYAQATTCEEYIRQTWPKSGMVLVQALDAALRDSNSSRTNTDDALDYIGLKISVETTPNGKLKVTSEGHDENLLIELAQQLAWLGSALSTSPFGEKAAYAKASFRPPSSASKMVIAFEHSPLHVTEMACWLPLFSGAVIACGFPIPLRGDEIGLEISLELLARIAGVQHAVEFEGGVVMKSFSHMFVPVRKIQDRVQWHVVSSADSDTHLTYRHGLSLCGPRALLREMCLDDIKRCRAFVGWCSVAQSCLGSDRANYDNIHYSTATDLDSSTKFDGASLGFQQFGTAAFNFKFGVKEGKCHFKRDGPYRNIVSWAENTPVVLYDTAERRGWLVPASEVMLHIIQCRHRLEPSEVAGKRITLDTNVPVNSSAKAVLLKNMSVKLSDEEHHTFKSEIATIWSLLDFLVAENVAKEQNHNGATVKSTWCDDLNGFEFNAVVEQHSPFRQKQSKLSNTNGGWPMLTKDIDALVLLANGFEDIIVPAAAAENKDLCRSWQRVPKEKDFLATSIPMLKRLYRRAGCPLDRKYLTSTPKKLQWHQGNSMLFDSCEESNFVDCQCNRLQQILPKSTIGTIVPPGSIDNQGAVIFGHSGSMLQDILSKPRPQIPKYSGMYSQQNVQLTPIVVQQDSEDTSFSDGDTSGRSGSEFNLDSTPGSLYSCTTLCSQDSSTQLNDAMLGSFSKKRGRLPDIQFVLADEDNEFMDFERKRLKGGHAQDGLCPPITDYDCESMEDVYDRHRHRSNEKQRPSDSGDEFPASARNSILHSVTAGDGEAEGFGGKPGDAGLAVRVAEIKSQRMLRRQSGFYQRTAANG